MFFLTPRPLHMLCPRPDTLRFPLAKSPSQLWVSAATLPHSFTEMGAGFPGSPTRSLRWAPSAAAIIVLDLGCRNLLFVSLFLHLPLGTELLGAGNRAVVMTESPAPGTTCHTVLSMHRWSGSLPHPHSLRHSHTPNLPCSFCPCPSGHPNCLVSPTRLFKPHHLEHTCCS